MVDPIPTPALDAGTVTESGIDPLTAAVNRLAKLSPLEYDKVRKAESKALGVQLKTLDSVVKAARKEESSESDFEEVEPWPNP